MASDLTEFFASEASEPTFRSEPWYSKAGDCLTCFFADKAYFAERVDDVLTVYRAFETDEIVGFQIKGVRALLTTLGSYCYEFADRDFDLSFLCMASSTLASHISCDPPVRQRLYQDLLRQVGRKRVRLPDLAETGT